METNLIVKELLFWGVWILIPLVWEIAVGFFSAVAVLVKYFSKKDNKADFRAYVTILIPVFNSEKTLESCLNSVYFQDYPKEFLEVFVIDNGSVDNSYEVFSKFQENHPELRMWWYRTEQGKSKALNKGIFGSNGKYIINIDSDGRLEKHAISNIVSKFESREDIACMTGVVLIDPELIEKTKGRVLKATRVCELMEYTESFLVGRNFQSMMDSMYTLAGAFSCFRKDTLLKTQMYNSETLGEDTHMTFQMKSSSYGKVALCENAFFYVEPIESLDRLYIQRQRWQRGELEVASLFSELHLGGVVDFIRKPTMRKLVSDHTLSFPRLVWIFAMIYMYFIDYPLGLLVGANLLLYSAYVFNSFIYLIVSKLYLKNEKNTKKYISSKWYYCFILPFYRFVVFWMRMAGIINSLKTESAWKTKGFKEEYITIKRSFQEDVKSKMPFWGKVAKWVNK